MSWRLTIGASELEVRHLVIGRLLVEGFGSWNWVNVPYRRTGR